ncbi:MAG TPA: NAD-dependent epimerase/dehydratase family protein [Thermodesulfobacteriaceae bacterium]|nr:NAD-dependent epimerase/dehydratase family protein [Thermodesulfobacteriaceae bacterium]
MPNNSLDAVFTDPPYFGNVQYAELMDFCYVWLKRLVGQTSQAFEAVSTRNADELTGNVDMGRDLDHFTEGLSAVFRRMSKALKPGAPLAFTYHHNKIEAYYPVAVAILDAGLTCSASLPCPAEMGASIHINGTGSSIIDTVFVCRSTGIMQRKWLADSPDDVARIVKEDLAHLRAGNVKPTSSDIRCITFGHLIRLAIWSLRSEWDKNRPTASRLADVANWLQRFGGQDEVEKFIEINTTAATKDMPLFAVHERVAEYGAEYANVYGPRQIPHGEAGVVAIFMDCLLNNQPCIIYHFPEEPEGMIRDYCFVGDVVRANMMALETGTGMAFNIGTGREIRTQALFDAIFRTMAKRVPLDEDLAVPARALARKGDLSRSCLKIDLAREKLGWQPKNSLEEGLVKTLDWRIRD